MSNKAMFEGMFNSMLKPMLLKMDTPELKDIRDVFVEAVDDELQRRGETTATGDTAAETL